MSNSTPTDIAEAAFFTFTQNIFDLLPSMKAPEGSIDRDKVHAWVQANGWTNIGDVIRAQGGEDLVNEWNHCDPGYVGFFRAAGGGDDTNYSSGPPVDPNAACYLKFWDSAVQWATEKYISAATVNPSNPSLNLQGSSLRGTALRGTASSRDATLDKPEATGTSTGTVIAIAIGAVALAGAGYYAWTLSQKKTKSNPAGLRSETNNSRVEREVRSLAKRQAPGADQIFPAFEHGHWWVSVSPDPDDPSDRNSEATFSVFDTGLGLGLERV
jgi:hypothetical protein